MANRMEITPVLSPVPAFPRPKRDKRNQQHRQGSPRERAQQDRPPAVSGNDMQAVEQHEIETHRDAGGYTVGDDRKCKITAVAGPRRVNVVI